MELALSLEHQKISDTTGNRSFLARTLKRLQTSSADVVDSVKGPYGLTTLFEPSVPATVDLVFVHGLGGGSRSTWAKNGNLSLYWPKEWLPRDPAFRDVRIHSFGYDSNWDKGSILNIDDFAKSLLGSLQDCPTIPRRSSTPIVMVAHSMGGLVIKKAFILARQLSDFDSIAERVRSMFFLATPHHGADMAKLLSRILVITPGARPFVKDLHRNSLATQSINDEFPQHCGELQLYSFYETLPTNYFVTKSLVVEKDLAVLGYQNERATLLNANHRGVCKYLTPRDTNYLTIRNALASVIESLREIGSKSGPNLEVLSKKGVDAEQQRLLDTFLGVSDAPEDDFMEVDDRRMRGSCEWLPPRTSFKIWRDGPDAQLYWISAPPGTGKTILSGYVVDHLKSLGRDRIFYFFHDRDKLKSSISYFLQSVAWQMARIHPEIFDKVLEIRAKDEQLCKTEFRTIWRKLFRDGILRVKLKQPLYWVIDALDECKAATELVPLLLKAIGMCSIRILLTSRDQSELHRPSVHGRIKVHSEEIFAANTKSDILLYLQANLDHIPSVDEASRHIMAKQIVEKSAGSFLWVSLVLHELREVHTSKEIQQVLEEVPAGMDALYSRILGSMSKATYGKLLAKAILTWTVCAARPLALPELDCALNIDIKDHVDNVQKAIRSSCGQLLYVDAQNPGRVHMVHQTARAFLLQTNTNPDFCINKKDGHKKLLITCLEYLNGPEMKGPRRRTLKVGDVSKEKSPFASYACRSFYEHIPNVSSTDVDILAALAKFLLSYNVLSWIEYIAKNSNLNRLIYAGKNFSNYLRRRSKHISPLGKEVAVIESWATDLGRLVAKFGRNLKASPSSIFSLIPPFCPLESAPRKQFASTARGIAVFGLSSSTWDDCLSTIDFQHEEATALSSSDTHFAVGLSKGRVILYNEMTYQEVQTLQHSERVMNLQFGKKGGILASSGKSKLRVWDISTWQELWAFHTTHKCMSLAFADDDKAMIGALSNNQLMIWDLTTGSLADSADWVQEPESQRAAKLRQPTAIAFCLDVERCQLAAVYRGQDILLWDVERDSLTETFSRKSVSGERIPGSIVYAVAFNSGIGMDRLAASYWDGSLVLFDTTDGSVVSMTDADAQTLASSPDGRTLASGDTSGTIQLFDFETLKLLYRVSSEENAIRSLAFSGDGKRLIDIRGSQCRIWDPLVLVRQDTDEEASGTVSLSTVPPELNIEASGELASITAISCPKNIDVCFCGKDDGAVAVYNANTGQLVKELFSLGDGLSVLSLLFNDEKHTLTSCDSSSRVRTHKLTLKGQQWEVLDVLFDHTTGEAVDQILGNEDHNRLLISLANTDTLYSLQADGNTAVKKLPWNDRGAHRWANHPRHHDQLILVQKNAVHLYEWQTLNELTDPEGILLGSSMLAELSIRSSTPCFDNVFLATTFSKTASIRAKSCLMLFNLNDFVPSSTTVVPAPEYQYLSDEVEFLIGAHRSRLLFLHSSGWICSTVPETANRTYVRHFPIPSDWLCTTNELLIEVRCNSDIILVKRDEVAVIKRGLDTKEAMVYEAPGFRRSSLVLPDSSL